MKRIKLLLVLFIVLFLSGCTVNYNLTINDDLSVNEKVEAKEITNRMRSNTGLDRKESVHYLYDMFDRKDIKTKLTYKSDSGYTTGVVTGTHDSLEDYSESFKSDIVPDGIPVICYSGYYSDQQTDPPGRFPCRASVVMGGCEKTAFPGRPARR